MKASYWIFIAIAFHFEAIAHESSSKSDGDWEVISVQPTGSMIRRIRERYNSRVSPIFNKKCFDCHGKTNALPWYSSIPGPKQIIQNDMRNAKEHLDMSNGFPFQGHGTVKDDLNAIVKSVETGEMPPLRYRLLHWGSKVTDTEIDQVLEWKKYAEEILQNETQPKTNHKEKK